MKNKICKRILAAVLVLTLSVAGPAAAPAVFSAAGSATVLQAATVKVTGTYHQTDARKMLKKINKFRTGKNAWYWNESNTAKVKPGKLKKLSYDYKLEKTAMKRAAEIALSFSHTRPNGQLCFSAFPNGYGWKGENIAMGSASYVSMNTAFTMWQENDQPYAGQGHRRNMLHSSFTCVGIACFEYKGCKYWVQEFGSPTLGKKKTKAVDGSKTVKISK